MRALVVLSMLSFAGAALAQGSASDQSFYHKAAEGGMAEVEAGKLAQDKGSSEAVKEFGEMMAKDHSQANAKLAKIAADKKVALPKELNAEHRAMKKKLESLSGAQFDKAYVQGQIKDHEATVALFKREIESGADGDAKQFAKETLPTVEAHLQEIRQIADQIKVAAADGKSLKDDK